VGSRIHMLSRGCAASVDDQAEIVDEFVRGPQVLQAGAELWSLVQPDRARKLDELIGAIHDGEDLCIDGAALDSLARELDGVHDAIRGSLADLGARNVQQLVSAMPSFAGIWHPDQASLASDLEAAAVSVQNLQRFLRRAAEQRRAIQLSY
jgi:hypothetical protein